MKHTVLIIQNDEPETLGLYESILKTKSKVELIHAYAMKPGDKFPKQEDFDAFVVGATPISANDVEKHRFLRTEWEYLKQITVSGKPLLGVCCGGQMLSRLLGGEVKPSPEREIGGYTVKLTEEGLKDSLFRGFPQEFPVFHWHSEMFTVPPGGYLLATGSPCPIQAFGHNNVRGLIFHLELTVEDVRRWAEAYPLEPELIGKTIEEAINECEERKDEMSKLAERLIDNLLEMAL
jgi:GMP synthase (glutamine-hydrolysing)